jgi:esterase/lipase superfamily enzyme
MNESTLRQGLSIFLVLVAAALSAACASRPENGFLVPTAETAPGADAHGLLVASTRERDARPGTLYNGERAGRLDYAKVTVSIPRTHTPGEIEWPPNPPGDPNSEFVVRQAAYLDSEKAFIQQLNVGLASQPAGNRRIFLFIHGYDTLFAEGLYRFAQVVHDSESRAVPVLFTWASRGRPGQYIYDTNSATAARDELTHILRLLLASNADHIVILAHSLGNWVTVEALRQLEISSRPAYSSASLGPIILAAPDIDVDVFKAQLRSFGDQRRQLFVVLSEDDRALALSRFVAGGENRVGDDPNVRELASLGVTVIDLTNLKASDYFHHAKFAELAEAAPQLASILAKGLRSNPSILSQRQQDVGGTLGAVVTSSLTVLGAPITITADRN